jgi:HD-GYP domain-containing protein (c-di-GMP phosphodiesterase class II)
MYSEKHRRKAQSLATLAGASRQLFVRAGRAMRPDQSIGQVIQEIAAAANEELSLLACVIAVPAHDQHPAISVLEVATDIDSGQHHIGLWTSGEETSIQAALPPDAWLLNVPIPDDRGNPGRLLLAGLPNRSFRPDAPMAMALADLVHAVVASGRARADASRAGRERDIHNDLAHVLAREGSLEERMHEVTRLIAEFTGATGVSIEGLARTAGEPVLGPSLMFGATSEFALEWRSARSSPEAHASMLRLAQQGPCVITDVVGDPRVDDGLRPLLVGSSIKEIATAPVRFDGEVLALLGAVSQTAEYFTEDLMSVLTAIAEHLAPAMKVALLRDELEASFAELEAASHGSLARLADAAEARDPHTAGHLRRIGAASYELALAIGLPEEEARAVERASAVHDLGKLGLPDAILHKPGRLSEDDWVLMRLHPMQGERLLGDSPRFLIERQVARSHHERWDGSGYPDGLRGDGIPLAARIVAVADALDALTTERSYKPAWALDAACAEILRESGRFYCPTVCAALEQLWSCGRLKTFIGAEMSQSGHGEAPAITVLAA